jgi:hypothetical protein
MCASQLYHKFLPGVNTDNERSHGHLCLRKKNREPMQFGDILRQLLEYVDLALCICGSQ